MNKKQTISPTNEQIKNLLKSYQNRSFVDTEKLAILMTKKYPNHPIGWKVLGALFKNTGRLSDSLIAMERSVELNPKDPESYNNLGVTLQALRRLNDAEVNYKKAIDLKPDYAEAYNNLGNTLKGLMRLEEAESSHNKAISLKPDYAESYNNLGVTLQALGRLENAQTRYKKAIALKPDYAEAFNNLGNVIEKLGRLDEAKLNYKQAIKCKPDYANAFWNLAGCEKTIIAAEKWIDKTLEADVNHQLAKLMKAALRFYQGDRVFFDNLKNSKFNEHPYVRSFSWAFGLPNLPELHFNKWYFFDAIIKKCITSKPFYEFGVWNGASFKYLINTFKKGYGFDTFEGLPEDWSLGTHVERKGAYSSRGNVPKIKGGEFSVGKFEDSLPIFFSKKRPIASLINFDADLYSSTICALNFSKPIIGKDTILIFDEFIMNESWEKDEFKALNEFCYANNLKYEVLAISFFTKQVAVKLVGIK